ncbi:hypothetical protein EGJ57_04700 [Brucella anthropi]|nr:hypothetical protein EGJ57_04700 [Brucella anthropi]
MAYYLTAILMLIPLSIPAFFFVWLMRDLCIALLRAKGGQQMLNELRWQLFKALSWIGWKVCPEPHRTRLQQVTPTWKQYEASKL